MALRDDLERAAASAAHLIRPGEELAGIVSAEAEPGERTYLCAFLSGEERAWVVLDAAGEPVTSRDVVRRTVSITALCEIAEESACGGELESLRERLVGLRLTENPPGIEEAEEAALALERVIGAPPRLAEPGFLDRVGAATRRLEEALGPSTGSSLAEAMRRAPALVEDFSHEVETSYKLPLE